MWRFGRWSKILSSKVKSINLLDPSDKALSIAKKNLKGIAIMKFTNEKFDNVFENESFDFIFSLGVLHHMENIDKQIIKINRLLKRRWVNSYLSLL